MPRANLDGLKTELGKAHRAPGRAAIAVATAIPGDIVGLTGRHGHSWHE